MKKQLPLAALVAATAFVGVSFLAQAEDQAPAPEHSMMMMAAETTANDEEITADCETLAAAPKEDGSVPSDEEQASALENCLHESGHNTDADSADDGHDAEDEEQTEAHD